jgi:hypothetical protein
MISLDRIYKDICELGLEGRFAIDVASVHAGLRPRGLLHVAFNQSRIVSQWLKESGFRLEAERTLSRAEDSQTKESILRDLDGSGNYADLWHEIWFSGPEECTVSEKQLFGNPGKWLGYPTCCVDFMQGQSTLANHFSRYLHSTDEARHWEINRLASLFTKDLLMLEFFPCSLSCAGALSFSHALLPLARRVLPISEFAAGVSAAQMPLLIWGDCLVGFPEWKFVDGRLNLKTESAKKVRLMEIGCEQSSSTRSPRLLRFAHLAEGFQAHHSMLQVRLVLSNIRAEDVNCGLC